MRRKSSVPLLRYDHRTDQGHSVHPFRSLRDDASCDIAAVGLARQSEALSGQHDVQKVQHGLQHLVGILDVRVSSGLPHSRQIQIHSSPACPFPEYRLHAPAHQPVVRSITVNQNDRFALAFLLIIQLGLACPAVWHLYLLLGTESRCPSRVGVAVSPSRWQRRTLSLS
ncbi:hypothetical protein D3C71_1559310 [compost metagenome]